jgi:hypothetical protein
MKDKIILTDIDGVCLDWEFAFHIWMEQHGFQKVINSEFSYSIGERYNIPETQGVKLIKMFNESAAIGFLPAHRDAAFYIKRLHENHGYKFHAITSLSTDPNAQKLREMNLAKLFGKTAFASIVCLETGADKDQALLPYKDSGYYWLEDKIANAEVGADLGLRSLLMEHGHNLNHQYPGVRTIKNWEEAYGIITSSRND